MNIKFKILWLENSLGLAIDQVNLNNYTPLTSYYFWPRSNVWEQTRFELNSKEWLAEREKIIILNKVTEILNSWQKNTKNNLSQDKYVLDFIGTP